MDFNDSRKQKLEIAKETQIVFANMLLAHEADADWAPAEAEWSLRQIAAHMYLVEKDCFRVRVQQLVNDTKPTFEYFNHDNWDFEGMEMRDSLEKWMAQREAFLAELEGYSEQALTEYVGGHAHFGVVNAMDILQIATHHDIGHMEHLRQILTAR